LTLKRLVHIVCGLGRSGAYTGVLLGDSQSGLAEERDGIVRN